jgi:transposase
MRARFRAERDQQLARRWQALWLLREGRRLGEVARVVGVAYRTVQQWVAWYRRGGLEEVAARRVGGLRRAIRPVLTPAQEAALVERASTAGFATRRLALEWLSEQFGVTLTMRQLERLFARLRLRLKVPRPLAARADAAAQAAWKKGGSPSA